MSHPPGSRRRESSRFRFSGHSGRAPLNFVTLDLFGRLRVASDCVAPVQLVCRVQLDEEPQYLAADQARLDEDPEAGADGLGAETLVVPAVSQVAESPANGLFR